MQKANGTSFLLISFACIGRHGQSFGEFKQARLSLPLTINTKQPTAYISAGYDYCPTVVGEQTAVLDQPKKTRDNQNTPPLEGLPSAIFKFIQQLDESACVALRCFPTSLRRRIEFGCVFAYILSAYVNCHS